MNRERIVTLLREHGIQPSAHRVAVAEHILTTDAHPGADQVLETVRRAFPMISRATVYNTLNLLVEKGLLRECVLTPGRVVFDPKTDAHHHFIDDASGTIHDVPWDAVEVRRGKALDGLEIRELQVVMRGSRRRAPRRA